MTTTPALNLYVPIQAVWAKVIAESLRNAYDTLKFWGFTTDKIVHAN